MDIVQEPEQFSGLHKASCDSHILGSCHLNIVITSFNKLHFNSLISIIFKYHTVIGCRSISTVHQLLIGIIDQIKIKTLRSLDLPELSSWRCRNSISVIVYDLDCIFWRHTDHTSFMPAHIDNTFPYDIGIQHRPRSVVNQDIVCLSNASQPEIDRLVPFPASGYDSAHLFKLILVYNIFLTIVNLILSGY